MRRGQGCVRGLILGVMVFISLDGAIGTPTASAQTVNPVYFSDDFENGLSRWTESGGYWGTATCDYRSTATSVSATPVSGASCPTNYPLNVNAVLMMLPTNAIDLRNATHPYLSFWHKYSIAATCLGGPLYCYWYYDYGYVEVSTNYGVGWTQIASFTGEITGWTPQELDLTPYIGNKILIRFRLWDGGYGNVSWGWLLDDVEVREKGALNTGLTVSSSPSGGGIVTGGGINCPPICAELWPANWNLSGRDWALVNNDYETPPSSISASPNGNYALYANSTLELADAVDISQATAPALLYWDKYSIASTCLGGPIYCHVYYDYGYVEISQDYGVTWTQLTKTTGTVSSWTPETLDLTPYITGGPILIRFRLWDGGYGNVGWGWKVDDVQIKDLATAETYFSDDFGSSQSVPSFANVTLTATPSSGYSFGGWTGCNTTNGNSCTVNTFVDKSVTANFIPFNLLSVSTSGSGTVISGDGYINCGRARSHSYPSGATLALTAVPAVGFTLSNWSGCNSTQGNVCTVSMSSAQSVTANFAPVQIGLISLQFRPSTVRGGQIALGTLTLAAAAPSGGVTVGLTSSQPRTVYVPSSIYIRGGASDS